MNACSANCGWCGACTDGYDDGNATCPECHRDFWKDHQGDTGPLCDACCRLRDMRQSERATMPQRKAS